MEFYNVNKYVDECNNFFKPVDDLYKTGIQKEVDKIKAQRNQINHLKSEVMKL